MSKEIGSGIRNSVGERKGGMRRARFSMRQTGGRDRHRSHDTTSVGVSDSVYVLYQYGYIIMD